MPPPISGLDRWLRGRQHRRFGDAAWVIGGPPTEDFLQSGTEGKWLHDFYERLSCRRMARLVIHPLALPGLGVAVLLGIDMRTAVASGALLVVYAARPAGEQPIH